MTEHITDHMNEKELIEFRAETMRQFKGTDAYDILYGAIVGQIQLATSRLLDRRLSNNDKMNVIVGELRALNDVIAAINAPQLEKAWYDKGLAEEAKMDEMTPERGDMYEDDGIEYRGAGGAL